MKARVKATGEIWTFSQIDEITFKSAINGHLYCAEELEFIEASIFSPDYWEKLLHQYAGMAMQGILTNPIGFENIRVRGTNIQIETALLASEFAHALVEKIKENEKAMH